MKKALLSSGLWLLRTMFLLGVIPLAGEASIGATNPVKVACQNRRQAQIASFVRAAAEGGQVIETTGTPSMEPMIHGKVFAVVVRQPYAAINLKDVLVYMGRPDAATQDRRLMLHRAVMHDRGGWIMSGDNNRWSESWDRMTPGTYVGSVVALYSFPQA